ncbi:MAG: type I restriction endonuclease [Epulopiscium sp. Nele67-Bin004]|nr:MAG: type I restriction endonuclease [Epulopiscium sp. Nele67-Bin004]
MNFAEQDLEQAIIQLFEQQGYTHTNGTDISRKTEDILIIDDLKQYLNKRYPTLSEVETQKVINTLEFISPSPLYEGNRETFSLINKGFSLIPDNTQDLAIHIDYIDYDQPDNNIFKVVNQYSVQGDSLRRPDLLVFINGIPIAICEFKSAVSEQVTIYDAWEQVHNRYNRDIKSLMKYCFISVISEGANTKMGTIFTPYAYYYAWNKANEDEKVSNGISSLITMIKGAFAKDRILPLLQDFIFYPDDSKKNETIICRYPQFFGALKMFENIKSHLQPFGDGKGGTYFGATGCGKTYTMLYLTRLLVQRDREILNNPTIIIILYREDLDTQTSKIFVTATDFLQEQNIRSINSREDLRLTLKNKPSGGVYITTIQKFAETTGLLSERTNIICISDEAHRTQTGVGSKLVENKNNGLDKKYGFAKYLRDSFPNATYCGFTGTPIDDTLAVFGDAVDSYTMKEASDDGITVRIAYEPRLARVILSDKQTEEIEKYYNSCASLGTTEEQIHASKRAMSKMTAILGNKDRINMLALDIIIHYEKLCEEKPEVLQKAMIVCSDRKIALNILKAIYSIRPEWEIPKKSDDESLLSKEQLDKLVALPKVNLVATKDKNDPTELAQKCGTKEHRKMLDTQFKNQSSNFKIAIVVDMWITGFDVPSLSVMYIDKPLKKHTLIQTISRVNRVFDGKDKGLVVDYIGIKDDMLEAIKQYGNVQESPVDNIKSSVEIFRNHLSLIEDLFNNFDKALFYTQDALQRLLCINQAVEYIQQSKDNQDRFMGLCLRLKKAYTICSPSGELLEDEISKAQLYFVVRSIIYKQTKNNAPDIEKMNSIVENMVQDAITCTGIENIVDTNKSIDLFSDNFLMELNKIDLPITKFNALLKLLKQTIKGYGKINQVKALDFEKRLQKIIDEYNNRDSLVFTSKVVSNFVDDLSDQIVEILRDLQKDEGSFKDLGITIEEKAFYDILVKVRDEHNFPYEDNKCLVLAKKIKDLIDDKSKFADWNIREDIKNSLNMELTILLYQNGYPPEWNEEIFDKIMKQTENMKKNTTNL